MSVFVFTGTTGAVPWVTQTVVVTIRSGMSHFFFPVNLSTFTVYPEIPVTSPFSSSTVSAHPIGQPMQVSIFFSISYTSSIHIVMVSAGSVSFRSSLLITASSISPGTKICFLLRNSCRSPAWTVTQQFLYSFLTRKRIFSVSPICARCSTDGTVYGPRLREGYQNTRNFLFRHFCCPFFANSLRFRQIFSAFPAFHPLFTALSGSFRAYSAARRPALAASSDTKSTRSWT